MKLTELAKQTGATAGLLSQIERGTTTPSIATLKKIADALQVPVGYFFEEVGEPKAEAVAQGRRSPVVHEHQRKILSPNRGVTFYLLNPDMSGPIEFIYNIFEPGASTGEDLYTHPGVECGLVLEGELEVQVGDQIHVLGRGDSITFSSEVPHRKRNVGKGQAISIWANSPPWF
jgi:transcriptional regulator with XRE-family HTH domain